MWLLGSKEARFTTRCQLLQIRRDSGYHKIRHRGWKGAGVRQEESLRTTLRPWRWLARSVGWSSCPGSSGSSEVGQQRLVQGVATVFPARTRRHSGYCHTLECYVLQKGTSEANLLWYWARNQEALRQCRGAGNKVAKIVGVPAARHGDTVEVLDGSVSCPSIIGKPCLGAVRPCLFAKEWLICKWWLLFPYRHSAHKHYRPWRYDKKIIIVGVHQGLLVRHGGCYTQIPHPALDLCAPMAHLLGAFVFNGFHWSSKHCL